MQYNSLYYIFFPNLYPIITSILIILKKFLHKFNLLIVLDTCFFETNTVN